jgi:putative oxidoreductase
MLDSVSGFDPLPRTDERHRIDYVALVLRLGLGAIFLLHGWDKLDLVHGNYGADWAGQMWAAQPAGAAGTVVPAPLTYQWVQLAVAWAEFLGGAALILGLFTRVAALGMIVIQIGAIFLVTAALGFFHKVGGWEYNFVLLAACLATFVAGGGAFSLDHFLVREIKRERQVAATKRPESNVLQSV